MIEPRPLGRTGLTVSSLGLGTAALAVRYGAPGAEREPPDARGAERAIEAALEAGITIIDTAPAYGDAEALVGRVAGAAPCVIATKLAVPADGWDALDERATIAVARASAEASLVALRRDRIDVLQIHNATAGLLERGAVPAALEELRADGVIRATGATVYGEADALAAVACPAIDVVQVAHSALDRRPERRVLPAAAASGTAVTTRSALLRGVLSERGRDLDRAGPFGPLGAAADAFRRAAGVSWERLPGAAVAFAAARPGIASVTLGPRDAGELRELLDGAAATAGAVAAAGAAWQAELPGALLDPSRWPPDP